MTREAQKQATRAKILDLAARRMREEGLAGNAVHRLMRDAGLTHGGFYVHFESKEALDAAAFAHATRGRKALDDGIPPGAPRSEKRKAIARRYLSRAHRDHRESGCAFSALMSEAAHGGAAFRRAFSDALVDAVERRAPGADRASQAQDLALMALAMGGLALARAVPDAEFSDAILRACREASNILIDAFEIKERTTP